MTFLRKYEQTIITISLVLINSLIKGIFLSVNSLSDDEPFSVYHAQMDIASIVRLLSKGNNPPLYEIILHFWIKLFGISEFSVRFPSLLFSSITVLFIYRFGLKYLNKRIALYASIFFILSNYQILFAQEARVYSLLGMLSVISMYYFLGILDEYTLKTKEKYNNKHTYNRRKNIMMLIIANTLIIYSHYFGFFILLTQIIFLIFNRVIVLTHWKELILITGVISFLYTPNITVVLTRFIDSSSNGTWVKPPKGIYSIIDMLRVFTNNPYGENSFAGNINNAIIKKLLKAPVTIFTSLIIGTAIFNSILLRKYKQTPFSQQLVVVWFAFPFLFMFGISYIVPMFLDRYLMPSAIAFCFIVGISADNIIKKPKYKYIIPIIVCFLFITTVKPNISNKRNVKETVEKIKKLKTNNVVVYFSPNWFEMNFLYYYDIEYFKDYNTVDIKKNMYKYLNSCNIYPINNWQEVDTILLRKFDKVIFLDAGADFSNPNNKIKTTLDANYNLQNKYKFYEIFNVLEYKLE